MPKMKIVIASSEATPFIKTGGLADVTGALPIYLDKLGVDVKVVIPKYRDIDFSNHFLELVLPNMSVWMGNNEEVWCSVFKTKLDNIEYYFIEHHDYFSREGLYHDNNLNDYQDNAYRFGFFSRAVLQLCKDLNFKPDVVHANDWQTAAIPAYMKTWHWNDAVGNSASLLTIHNSNYQGIYNKVAYNYLGLGENNFSADAFESHGLINLLKGGIFFSDVVTTVSKTYAKEILMPYGGHGLAPYLSRKTTSFIGITNGIDSDVWNPENDKYIPANFSVNDMKGKKICKKELQKTFLLKEDDKIPIIGIISRFVNQKGFGMIIAMIDKLLVNMDVQLVVLGSGDRYVENFFGELPKYYSGRVGSYIGYDNKRAHLIEAGCDFFMMPSIFEPCGLNQMYSKAYGTLPIVTSTGGLEDTVENYNEEKSTGTGFKFYAPTPQALYNTIGWAVNTYYEKPKVFKKLQKQAMSCNHSWEESAKEYILAYKQAIKNKKNYDNGCR